MNKIIKLGEVNSLRIHRISEPGIYLQSLDEEEVLLPNAYITNEMQLDDTLEVFIYTDSEDRLVATTLKPYGYVNDFACLEVVDTAKFGAFLDMGLPKDLLVPKNRQKSTFNVGDRKVIQIVADDKTSRLIGTEKFSLEKSQEAFNRNDEVEILLYQKTPLGYKVIVNNRYDGLIFHNEIFETLRLGDRKKAYVKNSREDGKLDISLQKIGVKKGLDNVQKIIDVLKQHGGELDVTSKSDADVIQSHFALSKKAFKAALTQGIANKSIILNDGCIKIKL